jgi:hypothetical protein
MNVSNPSLNHDKQMINAFNILKESLKSWVMPNYVTFLLLQAARQSEDDEHLGTPAPLQWRTRRGGGARPLQGGVGRVGPQPVA